MQPFETTVGVFESQYVFQTNLHVGSSFHKLPAAVQDTHVCPMSRCNGVNTATTSFRWILSLRLSFGLLLYSPLSCSLPRSPQFASASPFIVHPSPRVHSSGDEIARPTCMDWQRINSMTSQRQMSRSWVSGAFLLGRLQAHSRSLHLEFIRSAVSRTILSRPPLSRSLSPEPKAPSLRSPAFCLANAKPSFRVSSRQRYVFVRLHSCTQNTYID